MMILGMGEVPFIPKMVDARPNSLMCHFSVHIGLATFIHALCTLYIVLDHMDVCR
jgi:hypothetical protein